MNMSNGKPVIRYYKRPLKRRVVSILIERCIPPLCTPKVLQKYPGAFCNTISLH